jgi:hypothetical protein
MMTPKFRDGRPDLCLMANVPSKRTLSDRCSKTCDVCGSSSVYVTGEDLSLCSDHARLSMDYGWVPWARDGRENRFVESAKRAD